MWKLLSNHLKPYRWLTVLTIILLAGQAAADLFVPNLMARMVNQGIMQGNTGFILSRGAMMLAVAFLSVAFAVMANYLASRIGTRFSRDVRHAVFCKVEGFSLRAFSRFGAASLITRTTNDVTQVQHVLVMGFRFILFSPVMCVGGLLMAYSMNPALLWLPAVAVTFLVVFMLVIMKIAVPLFGQLQKKIDGLNLVLRESLMGVRVIRAFDKMTFDAAKFETRNADLTALSVKLQRIMAFAQPVMSLIMSLSALSVTWFGGRLVSHGSMELGDVMAYAQYSTTILFSVLMMVAMFVMIPRAQASAARITEVLAVEPEIVDPDWDESDTGLPAGLVEFRDVRFSHEGASAPVLDGISFTARPGETVAVIGGTGSGKSTLVNLIPRFYDVTGGSVLVGGCDVRRMPQACLRARIGFVAQDDTLFSGTAADNIRAGKPDASDADIRAAAKTAQAYHFIHEKLGFDGEVSQGGANLSGGQKQRLAIARAVARKPAIYIFDDSFSALDYKTDAQLRAALKSEASDTTRTPATVIIVAQRISTVLDADRILVLDAGKLAGVGTHQELLVSCGVYREIVESQLGKEAGV